MTKIDTDLAAPILLLAMPQVLDPFFYKSVVLLVHHEEEGSFGFIVNRPTEIKVVDILKGMEVLWQGAEPACAFFGGPVQPQRGTVLFAPEKPLETADGEPRQSSGEALPGLGLALTQHIGDLVQLAEAPPERFRLFLGYAGWGEGQLVEEILRNDWLTAPVGAELIFAKDPATIWEHALRSVGIDPAVLPSWTVGGSEETTN